MHTLHLSLKRGYRGFKENYHPFSILPVMSKIFEKLLWRQLTVFADQNHSRYQCGFRKGFGTQYSLVAMLERWKGMIDDKNAFGGLLANFSKAYLELIIAKLNAKIKLIHDYLPNRQQRTKINHDFISWEEVLLVVLQYSVFGPTLFNIFLYNFFLVMKETKFTSHADGNTSCDIGNTMKDVISF